MTLDFYKVIHSKVGACRCLTPDSYQDPQRCSKWKILLKVTALAWRFFKRKNLGEATIHLEELLEAKEEVICSAHLEAYGEIVGKLCAGEDHMRLWWDGAVKSGGSPCSSA